MGDSASSQTDIFDLIGLTGWHFSKLIKDTLNKATGLELVEDKFSTENDNSFNRQVSGVVVLTGEKEILITISMSFKAASMLVAYMTNMPMAEIMLEEQTDGIEEISSIIAGQTKSLLASSTGCRYKYMHPFTIVGDNHHILQKKKVNSMSLKFRSGVVELIVTVTVQ